jgi:hypothetical protein
MAPSSIEVDESTVQQDNWGPQDDQSMGPGGTTEPPNGAPLPIDDDRAAGQGTDNPEFPRGSSVGDVSVSDSKGDTFREKQVKVLRSLPVCYRLTPPSLLPCSFEANTCVAFDIGPVLC